MLVAPVSYIGAVGQHTVCEKPQIGSQNATLEPHIHTSTTRKAMALAANE